MKKYFIIYLILFSYFNEKIQAKIIGFRDDYPFINHLKKDLEGMIEFVQSRSIMPNDSLQLVTNRRALLLFTPKYSNKIEEIQVTGIYNGKEIGKLMMNSPSFFPATDQDNSMENNLPRVKYSTKAWSIQLPASWMKQGLSLKFNDQNGNVGILEQDQFNFGAASELFLTNFRLGMLSKVRDPEELELDPLNEANDYFQTIPVAKLKLGTFLPLEIKDKIVMPNGKIYTPDNLSDSEGGWHTGDMREDILKGLFGAGINRANYGIFSSNAMEQSYFNFKQIQIHRGTGSYKNGKNIKHGLSGGNGLATLDSTKGNEFSHELGHSFLVDHYHGGEENNSQNEYTGWGYDANRNVMLGSLLWKKRSDKQNKVTWKNLYDFNTHPMASAEENGNVSKYTQFTNYTSEVVQKDLAKYSVISKESPTGYMVWNEYFKQMIIHWKTNYPVPKYFDVPIMTLVGFYDPLGQMLSHIYPALYGNLGYVYSFDKEKNTKCWLSVHSSNGTEEVRLESYRFNNEKMNMFHINFLYENIDYYSAKIFCNINGENKELSHIDIKSPLNKLPSPVIISDIHELQNNKLLRFLKLKLLNSHYYNADHSSISEIYLVDENNNKLSKKNWSIKYVTSEENIGKFHAKNAIDENPNTFWHTEYSNGWNNGNPIPFPHEIIIDLGDYYDLKKYQLIVYQDKGYNNFKNYMISASNNFENWEILAKGEFQNYQHNNFINLNQYSEYYLENEVKKRKKRNTTEKNKQEDVLFYQIKNKNSNFCLSILNNKLGYDYCNQNDIIQFWNFSISGEIKNKSNNMCVHVSNYKNLEKLTFINCKDSAKWNYLDNKSIVALSNKNYVLDNAGNNEVVLYRYHGGSNQLWDTVINQNIENLNKNKISENSTSSQSKKINKIDVTFKSNSETISGYLYIGNYPEINLYQKGVLDSDSNISFKIKEKPSCGILSIAESYGGFVYRKDSKKCNEINKDAVVIEVKQEKKSQFKFFNYKVYFITNKN